jgi:hypothetical protein
MSRSYASSHPSASMACSGTALPYFTSVPISVTKWRRWSYREISRASAGKRSDIKVQDGHRTAGSQCTDQYKHEVAIAHTRVTELSSSELSIFALNSVYYE